MANILTKKRHLSFTVALVIALVLLAGFFYPSTYAAFRWALSPKSTYQSRTLHLPFLWTQELQGQDVSWSRPPLDALSPFGYSVEVEKFPWMDHWRSVYGQLSDADRTSIPRLNDLLQAGMTCGAVRSGQQNGVQNGLIAFGCLATDHRRTFSYTGPISGLSEAVSIILQAQR